MDKRRFLQMLAAIPFLSSFLAPKAFASPPHDFTTDEGLRLAIESLFGAVSQTKSTRAWEKRERPHIMFAIGSTKVEDLPRIRKLLFNSIKAHSYKPEGEPIYAIGFHEDSVLCWRAYPSSYVYEDQFEPTKYGVKMRLSWWKR